MTSDEHYCIYEEACSKLPPSIINNIILVFIPVIDLAMIEVQSRHCDNHTINSHKWMLRLKQLHFNDYDRIISYPGDSSEAAINLVRRHLVCNDVMVICLMLTQHVPINFIFWSSPICSSDTLLLYTMLVNTDVNRLFAEYVTMIGYPWYLTALYLLQRGARTNIDTIIRLLDVNWDIQSTESYRMFVTFVANHPTVYGSNTTILNHMLPRNRKPIYAMYLHHNPVFAAQLIHTPGLDLGITYFGKTATYLTEALESIDIDYSNPRHQYDNRALGHIIRTIIEHNPEVMRIKTQFDTTLPRLHTLLTSIT